MLTIFTTPKPSRGHFAVIQRNAIESWTLLRPDCEVILFGHEEGAAEVARDFGIRHEPAVQRNERGLKYLNYLFDRAQEIARHPLMCYVNCDILLMSDFREAVQRIAHWQGTFLMVGRRWDLNLDEAWNFEDPDWEGRLRALALQEGKQREPNWIDYFVFRGGFYYRRIPPFVIGRVAWDNWLVWKARSLRAPVVDASSIVMAVHQNHDYSYHPEGKKGIWSDQESRRNYKLAGSLRHLYTIENATHKLDGNRIERNFRHWVVLTKREVQRGWSMIRAVPEVPK